MTHFGIICPGSTGHMNTMTPLGYELQQRGHRVTVFGVLDMEPKTVAAGLEFWAIGTEEYPRGAVAQSAAQLGKLRGLSALVYTIGLVQRETMMCLREAPEAIEQAGVEALLVDQVSRDGGTVAEYKDIPLRYCVQCSGAESRSHGSSLLHPLAV